MLILIGVYVSKHRFFRLYFVVNSQDRAPRGCSIISITSSLVTFEGSQKKDIRIYKDQEKKVQSGVDCAAAAKSLS